MRLICGLIQLDEEPVRREVVEAMASALTPKDLLPRLGLYVDGLAGLAVLDFSVGAQLGQPAGDLPETEGWVVAADARLDRPEAIALSLSCRRDIPTETLLVRALGAFGADFPDRVDGDFAVALWQRRERRLWLGRDFIGARPLAWTCLPGRRFAFASLPKGLHRAGLAGRTPDPVALGAMFLQNYFGGSDSGFTDIHYLLPGHSLVVGPESPEPRQHRAWRLDPALVGRWPYGPDAAAEELRHRITQAVAARLPAQGIVASQLSGGLDSSAITVLAARGMRNRPGRVVALSLIGQDHPELPVTDDRALIQAVLEQEGDIDWLPVSGLPFFDPGLADEDRPLGETALPEAVMVQKAARAGAGILLSGIGGDEGATYNGAKLYFTLLRTGRWRHLWHELPARAADDGVPLLRALYGRLVSPMLPEALHQMRRRARGQPKRNDLKQGKALYFAADIRNRIVSHKMPAVLRTNDAAERVRAFADQHIPCRLAFTAMTAARYGMAVSFPLLDRRVVDFVLSLPVDHFLADGQSRQPFRRAMRGILPELVRRWPHKNTPMADGYLFLSAAKADFLAMLDQVAAKPGHAALLDFALIRRHLATIPEPADALAFAQRIVVETWSPANVPWQMGSAVMALALARHLARLS